MKQGSFGRLDSVSVAGIAIFGALSVLLTTLSQALGLNFPLIPYLQFDFGEIAILLALFIFGPVPALISSFIEFLTLMAIGQNVPVGPVLKLIAILSSLFGIWVGFALVRRVRRPTLAKASGMGTLVGIVFRAAFMTIPNYYLIVFLISLPATMGFLAASFKLAGITLTASSGLAVILGFTALFNGLQLLFVSIVSYLLIRLPQLQSTRAAGRTVWITVYLSGNVEPQIS